MEGIIVILQYIFFYEENNFNSHSNLCQIILFLKAILVHVFGINEWILVK